MLLAVKPHSSIGKQLPLRRSLYNSIEKQLAVTPHSSIGKHQPRVASHLGCHLPPTGLHLQPGGGYSSFVRTKSLLTISVSEKNSIAKTLMVVYAGTAMSIPIIPAIWPPIIIIRKISRGLALTLLE